MFDLSKLAVNYSTFAGDDIRLPEGKIADNPEEALELVNWILDMLEAHRPDYIVEIIDGTHNSSTVEIRYESGKCRIFPLEHFQEIKEHLDFHPECTHYSWLLR